MRGTGIILVVLALAGCISTPPSEEFEAAATPNSPTSLPPTLSIPAGGAYFLFAYRATSEATLSAEFVDIADESGYLELSLFNFVDDELRPLVSNWGGAGNGDEQSVSTTEEHVLALVVTHTSQPAAVRVALSDEAGLALRPEWTEHGEADVSYFMRGNNGTDRPLEEREQRIGVTVSESVAGRDAWLGAGQMVVASHHAAPGSDARATHAFVFASGLAGVSRGEFRHDDATSGLTPLVEPYYAMVGVSRHTANEASVASLTLDGAGIRATTTYAHVTLEWDPASKGLTLSQEPLKRLPVSSTPGRATFTWA